MKYLCLIYEDEKWWEKASAADLQKGMAEYNAFTESIKKNGNYVGGEALQPTLTAKSVRVRNGKVSTTDGPFAETKEQLLGFYVVDCETLDAAIETTRELAQANPGPGAYEIRPVRYFNAGPGIGTT